MSSGIGCSIHKIATLDLKPLLNRFSPTQYMLDESLSVVSYPDCLEGADQSRGKGLANLGRMCSMVELVEYYCKDVMQWV